MDIHVTNLSFDATEAELRELFEPFGTVSSVHIVTDRRTRLKKGYAFVSMPKKAEAEIALTKLKGVHLRDRPLKLEIASSKPGGKKAPKVAFNGRKAFKKKLKIVTFDNEKPVEPRKRKKRQGAGRGTKY